jgi:endonuclease/exonuclease/phosphatase (EEP) superfamily protein YafD
MHWARVELPEVGRVGVSNLHATASRPAQASAEVLAAAEAAARWSGGDALVFGGDFNLRPETEPEAFAALRDRLDLREPTAPNAIDHVLSRGLEITASSRRLAAERHEVTEPDGLRVRLSDHRPVAAEFMR